MSKSRLFVVICGVLASLCGLLSSAAADRAVSSHRIHRINDGGLPLMGPLEDLDEIPVDDVSSMAPPWRARLAMTLDVGVPDGVQMALAYRPRYWLRGHLSGGHNAVSPGVRVGATALALNHWVTPCATLEVGHYFSGNVNDLRQRLDGDAKVVPLLDDVRYTYANAHVGVEFTGARLGVFVRGGLSYVDTQMNASESMSDDADDGVSFASGMSVSGWATTAKVGLIVYFL